ncbi:MAG: efflux RND transporter periplasmic adaptor subunit [Bryobacteraceae bacterium]
MKKLLILLVLAAVAGAVAVWVAKDDPIEVPFAKVKRETLVSTLQTNGKVEPFEWQPIRTETSGLVERVPVQQGQKVMKGQLVVALRAADVASELAAAEAQEASARAELAVIERGGRTAELTEIANAMARARVDLEAAQREVATLTRLVEKQAAPRAELETARNKQRQLETGIEALERKRASLVTSTDRSVSEAKLRESQAAAASARRRLAQSQIYAPIAGVLYSLSARTGDYLNEGAAVGNAGRLDRLRVRVYVDEPELGRVAVGQPITFTWDAQPGVTWTGVVEKMPIEIVTVGTRQVGEVLCTIDNKDGRLVVGTNVNAEILTQRIENALTVPKEAIRRQGVQSGVYVLRGDRIAWQQVTTGASSTTRTAVTGGLAENDAVALPIDRPLSNGMRVKPVFP